MSEEENRTADVVAWRVSAAANALLSPPRHDYDDPSPEVLRAARTGLHNYVRGAIASYRAAPRPTHAAFRPLLAAADALVLEAEKNLIRVEDAHQLEGAIIAFENAPRPFAVTLRRTTYEDVVVLVLDATTEQDAETAALKLADDAASQYDPEEDLPWEYATDERRWGRGTVEVVPTIEVHDTDDCPTEAEVGQSTTLVEVLPAAE